MTTVRSTPNTNETQTPKPNTAVLITQLLSTIGAALDMYENGISPSRMLDFLLHLSTLGINYVPNQGWVFTTACGHIVRLLDLVNDRDNAGLFIRLLDTLNHIFGGIISYNRLNFSFGAVKAYISNSVFRFAKQEEPPAPVLGVNQPSPERIKLQ